MSGAAQSPIAIIGLGCLFPKAADAGQFWSNILGRVDAITDVPPSHWRPEDYYDPDPKKPDHTYARRGGFLSSVDFPALEFGITPNALDGIDTTQLLGLMTAKQALDDAGYGPGKNFDRGKVSVILGITGAQELVIPLGARLGHPIWRRALKGAGVADEVADDVVARIADGYVGWQEDSFPGLLGNVVAGRIANRLDLGGTNCVVDAACASSLSAVHLAIYELASGRADMVLTGGMDTFNDIFMYMCFSKTPALSPSGDARPFDAGGDGTILGEGLGCLLLKRLADAERDGDKIYAVIKGLGTSSDGKGHAIYAPSPAGQARALRQAYEVAGVTPDTIDLVEAHGTGTKAGDAAEVEALADVYRAAKPDGRWCALGSVKSQVGHTKAAAGSAGLIKAALALHHKVLPPTIKVNQPIEPLASGQSPFYVNTEARPWLPRPANPRRAAVSSFGFGGSNFHCVLEEYRPEKSAIDWDGNVQLLAFAAKTESELVSAVEAFPATATWDVLRAEAASSRVAFRVSDPLRLLIVLERHKSDPATVLGGVRGLLKKFSGKRSWSTPDGIYFGNGTKFGALAMVFAGQGSQYTGMFRDLACRFPQMQHVLAEADAIVAADNGAGRLSDRIYPLPAFRDDERSRNEEALRRTDVAQPALGAVAIGALRVLEHFGVRPDIVAGHSYGELPALCAAKRFDFRALCRLSQVRGRLMADGGGDRGAMLAVQASYDVVKTLLSEEGLRLVIANRNGPKQIVLSGDREEITRAASACIRRGLSAKELPVSAAFHSPSMSALRAPFAKALADVAFVPTETPVFCNTTADPYPDDPEQVRALLADQLARAVNFEGEIENIYRAGARTFLEVGPAGKLTSLIGAILEGKEHIAAAVDASSGQRGVVDLARTLAQLAAAGHAVGLERWDASVERNNAPVKRPTMAVPLCGANYVKPRAPQPPAIVSAPVKGRHEESRNGHIAAATNVTNFTAPAAHANGTLTSAPPPSFSSSREVSPLDQAARLAQENLLALQKLGEQTARLHGQFLENQNRSLEAFRALVDQQQELLHGSNGAMPRATVPTPIAPPAAPAVASDRISAILLEIVSEKTGYPAELLGLDMELDADLGIDSIKRVEIFMLVQEKLPETPAIKSEHVGELRTLRDVVLFLGGSTQPSQAASGGRSSPEGQETGGTSNVFQDSTSLGGLTPTARRFEHKPGSSAILLEIVSEKTGYPVELLGLDMELDADLGIDSIKRVEIFMRLQEKLPEAPAIKSEHVGSLRTLRDVATFLERAPAPAGPLPVAKQETTVEVAPPQSKRNGVPLDGSRLRRYVLERVPFTATERESIKVTANGEIWIADDGAGLSAALATRMRELGRPARLVGWSDLHSRPRPSSLAGLIIVAPAHADDAFLLQAFQLLQLAGPALRQAGTSGGSLFVTVSRLDGAFGLGELAADAHVLGGGLAGLAKTAAHEWPDVACKAIDLDPALVDFEEAARALAAEVFMAGPREVGISAFGLSGLQLTEQPLKLAQSLPIGRGEVVIVSGGARGVTAEAAVALGQATGCTLLLLGRNPQPKSEPDWLVPLTLEADIKGALVAHAGAALSPREAAQAYERLRADREMRQTFDRIRGVGAQAVYRSIDVRDEQAVRSLLADVRSNVGPIKGLIHGAGVLADRRIDDQTLEQFQAVYSTKVQGLRALLAATERDELKAFALFSSSTGRFGRTGQVAYAVANEVLNKIAQQQARIRPNCRVVALNWGPWDGGMVTPALKSLFESEGVGLIPLAAGGHHCVAEMAADGPAEVVVLGDSRAPQGRSERRSYFDPTVAGAAPAIGLPVVFERDISAHDVPVLQSHVLGGRAVVPLALMIEWLAHAALHGCPGLVFHGFDDLRVLKGIRLAEGQSASVKLRAGKAVKHDAFYHVSVELHGSAPSGQDVLHSRATIVLANRLPAVPEPAAALTLSLYHRAKTEIYREVLFHGPELQGIERVEGCSEQGIEATARAARSPVEWLRQPLRGVWLADPLALDCAFQLMIVWSFETHGCGSLPTSAGRYRQFRRSFPREGVRIRAAVKRHGPQRAVADIWFLDHTGAVVARMEDYECVIDASLNQAFRRNQLLVINPCSAGMEREPAAEGR